MYKQFMQSLNIKERKLLELHITRTKQPKSVVDGCTNRQPEWNPLQDLCLAIARQIRKHYVLWGERVTVYRPYGDNESIPLLLLDLVHC